MSMMAHMDLEDFAVKNVLEDLVDLIVQLSHVRKHQFQFLKNMNIYVQNVVSSLCIKELEKHSVMNVR